MAKILKEMQDLEAKNKETVDKMKTKNITDSKSYQVLFILSLSVLILYKLYWIPNVKRAPNISMFIWGHVQFVLQLWIIIIIYDLMITFRINWRNQKQKIHHWEMKHLIKKENVHHFNRGWEKPNYNSMQKLRSWR